MIEEARASIKATTTYDVVLQKTREVLTTIHEDNVRLLGENDNLRLATRNLALQVSKLEQEKIELQDRMTDLVAAESLFDHRVREKEAQLEEQQEYRRLTEVKRDRTRTLALGLRDEVQVVQDQLKLEQEQVQERIDSLGSQLKDAHRRIEGLEDGIQRH